jgi:hypothetical protein
MDINGKDLNDSKEEWREPRPFRAVQEKEPLRDHH